MTEESAKRCRRAWAYINEAHTVLVERKHPGALAHEALERSFSGENQPIEADEQHGSVLGVTR